MITDPFAIKKFPKYHPKRLVFTAKARYREIESKLNFDKYALPYKELSNLPILPPTIKWKNTDVTPLQMQHLVKAVSDTDKMTDSVIVEVGCYRGVTTSIMANSTCRKVIAVDPYIGYGGSDEDFSIFCQNTKHLSNVVHERVTSGEAFRHWHHGPVSLVFIDAVHDYVNTIFDIASWSSLLVPGGILAAHDVDLRRFAGTRRAAFEFSHFNTLIGHPENLAIFRKDN